MFECQPIPLAPSLLGESPLWDDQRQCLFWCDIPGCAVRAWWPESGAAQRWETPCEPASLALRADGRLWVARRDGIWEFDPESAHWRQAVLPPYDPSVERFNDGKVGPDGRFWVGTIYEPRDRPAANLYCFDGKRLERVVGNITVSNGLAWSPDGRVQYWADTKAHRIQRLVFDPSGATGPSTPEPWVQYPVREPDQPLNTYGGRPDGAAVDIEGAYWIAMFEGARVLRLSPAGDILQEVAIPARCPTMVCFGDADRKTVYVTTASHQRPADELARWPDSGAIFRFRVPVAGLPVGRMP